MSFFLFSIVLLAALLHASWNAIVKLGISKQQSMLMLSVGHAVLSLPYIVTHSVPPAAIWPWIAASALIHAAYQLFLAYAYEQGDLSRVYPVARGGAPLIVLVFSWIVLAEPLAFFEAMGIIVLGLGILLMARGVFSNGESRRMLWFALGSACATAGYTIVDGIGARIHGDAVHFVTWVMLVTGMVIIPSSVALNGRSVLRIPPRAWINGMLAAAMSLLAYGIVVWAMTRAPIALVSALRETSIFFAVAMGWLFFGERMDRQKIMAAVLIVGGALLTRF